MSAPKGGRRQPRMPNLNLSRQQLQQGKAHAEPTSPPHTPTASPQKARKSQPPFGQASRRGPMDPHIQPVGTGHQFSYQPFIGPEQLSPRSASSSEPADDSDSDDEYSSEEEDYERGPIKAPSPRAASDAQSSEDESESEDDSDEDDDDDDEEGEDYAIPKNDASRRPISPIRRVVQMIEEEEDEDDEEEEEEDEEDSDNNEDGMSQPIMESPVYAAVTTTTTTVCDFVLEDMDPMDSDNGLSVLDPYEIESNRSRSSSKQRDDKAPRFEHRDLPIRMMQDLKNLNCSNEASDEEGGHDTEEAAFYKWQQHMRRRRLSVSSSITGKRTFSERSDSDDSDDGGLDVNEMGSSARRMRKRMHRGSLLFQDPPEPRIDELEEPNSSEDEYITSQHLGMELPYWTIEINEMEDSQ
ncbi:hypothetical protein LEL_04133 [Akanthomyces lecanii RCEF 1005]|uniref:Uncharacterized protein n=1 Tax=Akanthomyces lecanii RCEF 1005 TaxID=1081108 RepID=A0A168H4Z8_CORDF|nr:hypothetical protein LEL_04133 [Akanthomyces lecanii RCEF 1005]